MLVHKAFFGRPFVFLAFDRPLIAVLIAILRDVPPRKLAGGSRPNQKAADRF